jgi:hypothetical protein
VQLQPSVDDVMGDGFRRLARPVHHFLYGASRRQIHHDNPLVMRDTGADRERYASVDHRALRRRKTSGRIVAGASFVIAATWPPQPIFGLVTSFGSTL